MTTITITGGTGKVGRRVAERLAGHDLRIATRATGFDWTDRASWAPAVRGARAVFISYAPDLGVPGAADTVADFARLAVAAGAQRLVLLSGRGEEEALRAEGLVRAAGADCTVVRCAFFAQNFSEGEFAPGIASGELALPVGEMPEPFVDADDVADVVAAALTQDGHAGRLYELTGPRLLTFAEAAAALGAGFVSVPLDAFAGALREEQVPEEVVALLRYLFTEVMDGRNASLADGVQQALGRPPRDFGAYASSARTVATSSVSDAGLSSR